MVSRRFVYKTPAVDVTPQPKSAEPILRRICGVQVQMDLRLWYHEDRDRFQEVLLSIAHRTVRGGMPTILCLPRRP